jgi:hypothetical protein
MNSLKHIYELKCSTPSDINEHLPTLKKYAEECDHITEMGVRWVVSTYALLMGKPKKMISYDINEIIWQPITEMVKGDTNFEFRVANTLDLEIEETDLLFIDTLHNYNQLKGELELHGNKARKYIIFHDTTTFEWIGESYENKMDEKGLWYAIEEFLETNPHWEILERFTNNNGLTILKRK